MAGEERMHAVRRGLLALLLATVLNEAAGGSGALDEATEIGPFVEQMNAKHGVEPDRVAAVLREARILSGVLEAISRPAEAKPWYEYRPIFVTSERIAAGVRFWRAHRADLERAAGEFGVPPEIVVAIIGVETFYGRHTGRTRVLDSLATLAFRYPRRSRFFRAELEHFLLLAVEERLDPLTVVGSYAGAMGVPQFIASSYRSYAVDFDADERRDLLGSTSDAIGSVASYLERHGWRPGESVALAASVSGERFPELLDRGLKPHTPVADMAAFGVTVGAEPTVDPLGALIELDGVDGPEHWVGLQNFYAITRYNHSKLYAMAVYQLALRIRDQFEGG